MLLQDDVLIEIKIPRRKRKVKGKIRTRTRMKVEVKVKVVDKKSPLRLRSQTIPLVRLQTRLQPPYRKTTTPLILIINNSLLT